MGPITTGSQLLPPNDKQLALLRRELCCLDSGREARDVVVEEWLQEMTSSLPDRTGSAHGIWR
jgi:hypothetical protein